MGFHLWLEGKLAWAQGTYEYRPMGTAVISASDLFRRRDFDPRRKIPVPRAACYAGQFASLGHLNAQLLKRRRRPPGLRTPPPNRARKRAAGSQRAARLSAAVAP